MDLNKVAAVAASVIALASLALNIYQAFLLRRRRPQVDKIEEIRSSLKDLLNKLETRLLTEPAMQEQWDQGFDRLKEILPACGNCDRTLSSAKASLVPKSVQRAVAEIHNKMVALYSFQNSFHNFRRGREFVPYHDFTSWNDKRHAEARLHELQVSYQTNKSTLTNYYEKISR